MRGGKKMKKWRERRKSEGRGINTGKEQEEVGRQEKGKFKDEVGKRGRRKRRGRKGREKKNRRKKS